MTTYALENNLPFSAADVSASDRLGFTLFLGLVLHTAIIFGVSFSMSERRPAPQLMEITLAQYKAKEAPKDADFIAQANQEGSGSLEEKAMLSTTQDADYNESDLNEVQPIKQSIARDKPITETKLVSTTGKSSLKTSTFTKQPTETEIQGNDDETRSLLKQNLDIASLEAKLAQQQQIYAKRPRKRHLSSESTKEARDAAYIDKFRRSIERIGNLYYPAEARRQGIFGAIRLMVAIDRNGRVVDIKVLKSSGKKILDDAALRSVKNAAPFDPFPPEIKRDTDILEIVRTWKFEKGAYFSDS